MNRLPPIGPSILLSVACVFAGLLATAVGIGMRHDVPDALYLQCARNEGQFTPGEEFPDFSGVVAVGIPYGDQNQHFEVLGSGVLIGDRWIATAAHVVLESEHAQTLIQGMMVRFGPDIESGYEQVGIRRIYVPIHVEHLAPLGNKGRFKELEKYKADFNDFALLELMDPVAGYAVTPIAQLAPGQMIGNRVLIAGYGEAGKGSDPDEKKWVRSRQRRAAENLVDRIVTRIPGTAESSGGIIAMDFDSGLQEHNTLNGTVRDWEDLIERAPSPQTPFPMEGACYPGDSGGPAFIRQDNEWRLLGVAGFGMGFPAHKRRNRIQYGDTLIYTLVPAHAAWLRSIMNAGAERSLGE